MLNLSAFLSQILQCTNHFIIPDGDVWLIAFDWRKWTQRMNYFVTHYCQMHRLTLELRKRMMDDNIRLSLQLERRIITVGTWLLFHLVPKTSLIELPMFKTFKNALKAAPSIMCWEVNVVWRGQGPRVRATPIKPLG